MATKKEEIIEAAEAKVEEVVEEVKKTARKAAPKAKAAAEKVEEALEQAAEKAEEAVEKTVKPAAKKVRKKAEEVVTETKAAAAEVVEKTVKPAAKKAQEKTEEVVAETKAAAAEVVEKTVKPVVKKAQEKAEEIVAETEAAAAEVVEKAAQKVEKTAKTVEKAAGKAKEKAKKDAAKEAKAFTEKPRLRAKYADEVAPALMEQFGYKNVMEIPKLEKVIINMGLGSEKDNPKGIEAAAKELGIIAGQKAVVTRAKKSVANFKVREGMNVGAKVTLRGDRMYFFADKFMNIVLPRVRDFRGVSDRSFDGRGNYALGVKEQLIFPEINFDDVDKVRGMNIVFVTSAKTDEEAKALLSLLGMPFAMQG